MHEMTIAIVRVLVLLGVMVLLASVICLVYPFARVRSRRIALLAQAVAFSALVGAPLAVLGAHFFAPLRPLVGDAATNTLSYFPAEQGLASLLVRAFNVQDEVTPNLWTGLGIGSGFGVALALAMHGMVAAAQVAPGASERHEDGAGEGSASSVALWWAGLLALGAVIVPIAVVAAGSSLTPSSFVQLAPGDELVAGLTVGIAFGFLIASGAVSVVDMAGAMLARLAALLKRKPSVSLADDGGRAGIFSVAAAAPPILFLGTCWAVWITGASASAISRQNWASLVGNLLISPIVLAFVIWPGLLSGLAAGLKALLGASVARDASRVSFDAFTLLGGVLFGLILAGGTNVPLLGWLLGVIGTLGWPGLLIGAVLGGLLAGLPLIRRGLMSLPDAAWVVMGCALLSVGGILLLTPTWLS